MDENPKQKSLIQFIKTQFQKRAVTKFIILSAVSLFSLFFSHPTLLCFLHYFNFHSFSTLPLKLFSHTLDKNCTFLLCNGLLVFLANYSRLLSLLPSSPNKFNLNDLKSYEDDSQTKMNIMETTTNLQQLPMPLLEEQEGDELGNTQKQQIQNAMQHENGFEEREAVKAEVEDSKEENLEEEEEEEEEERAVLEEDEDKAENSFFVEEVDDEEEEEEGGNGKLSDEELNKKFDDFIRKMKEEIRIEARQQLIMV